MILALLLLLIIFFLHAQWAAGHPEKEGHINYFVMHVLQRRASPRSVYASLPLRR